MYSTFNTDGQALLYTIEVNRSKYLRQPAEYRVHNRAIDIDREIQKFTREQFMFDLRELRTERGISATFDLGTQSVKECLTTLKAARKEAETYKVKDSSGSRWDCLMVYTGGKLIFAPVSDYEKYRFNFVWKVRGSDLHNTGMYRGILDVEKECGSTSFTISITDNTITLKVDRVTYRIYTVKEGA